MSRPRLIALLLALVTLAIYLPAVQYGFTAFDDNDYVSENQVVQNGLTGSGVRWAFTTGQTGNWIPLTWISHMAVCQWFGLKAGAHHLVNLLFHTANAVLLFALLRRLTRALWPSAFAAALFAWHPLHVESVAWISERKDMLSTFFGLAALLAYTRYAQGATSDRGPAFAALRRGKQVTRTEAAAAVPDPPPAIRHPSRFYWLALVFFALSLMSKPMLVTLPFVLLLLDYWPLGRVTSDGWRVTRVGERVKGAARQGATVGSLLLEKLPFFALSAALCVITFLAQRAAGLVNSVATIPMSDRLENVPLAYSRYLLQMIWPAHLSAFYPFPLEISPLVLVAAILVLALISTAAWLGRNSRPYWLVGWLWFLGTLMPVNGLVTFGGQAMANRFTYFPAIGIFLAVALGFRDVAARFRLSTRVVAAAAGVGLAACLALAENQLRCWRDDVSLFSRVIDVTKDTRWIHFRDLGIIHYYLGAALEDKGRRTEAIAEYRAALVLRPYDVRANNHLGNALAAEGKWDEAIQYYERAIQIKPDNAIAHCNLGIALAAEGKPAEALQQYEQALQLKPDYAEAHFNLGIALAGQGKPAEALQQYERALQLKPDYAEAHNNLGIGLARQGRLPEAIQHFERALQLKPDDAEAHNNLGLTLANQGKLAEARQQFEQAIQIKPDYARAHNNLGIALASEGKSAEALQQFQQALALATAQGNTALAENIRARLRSYPPPLAQPQTP